VRPAGALLALVAAIELALGLYLAAGGASFPVTPWQAVVLIAIPLTALLAVLGSVVARRRKLGSSRAMQVAGGLGVLVRRPADARCALPAVRWPRHRAGRALGASWRSPSWLLVAASC